ncbi:MAG TPA: J domain-containing protein [Opitutus sp.]|nr:J domain-containing protein [Opitutus sp.]
MPTLRTHYDTLKVSRDAPIEVIQAAYRSLARKYHPDRNRHTPEGEALMKSINAAYEVLSDPSKRAEHDRWISTQLDSRRPSSPWTDSTSSRESASSEDSTSAREPDVAQLSRVLLNILFSICYFSTAFWLLRNPGGRLLGLLMLVGGWLFFVARRRR